MVMSSATASFAPPSHTARAAPVFWEPNGARFGERLVAIILVHFEKPELVAPLSYIAFSDTQLRALVGKERARSASGILEHASSFCHQQLLTGVPLTEVIPPLEGFSVGESVRVRGYSTTQVMDTAIRTLSAFGTRNYYEEVAELEGRNSLPTRAFLKSLQRQFSQRDESRKSRFNKTFALDSTSEMTIDYAHHQHLVQVTSLPVSAHHSVTLQKEAESKLFELDIAADIIRQASARARPALLVNTAPLNSDLDAEARGYAEGLLQQLTLMSEKKNMVIMPAPSPEAAAEILEGLAA